MRKQLRLNLSMELMVDLFAGGGGASSGIERATGLTLPSIRAYAFRAVTLLAVGCGNPDCIGAQPPIQRLGLFLCPSCVLRVLTGGAWARFGVAGNLCPGFPPHAPSVAHSPWKENATAPTICIGVRYV
ncbi:hypothetical protein SAMN02949497_3548 [Methylomagnum ishizawai]|uniref:Uncharacterized protein n=1 Tax=Methylomagnum ishizawai TaxID=1760988 RepID=A0A1Y6D5N2_9GAMM|nr:hypothetical protein SAMN02949497_3548 [Methylomagnum ishizawai]